MMDIFTDGSCPFNGKKKTDAAAGWACVFPSDPKRNASGRITENPTNNVAELMAIWMALEKTRDIPDEKLRIFSDSTYSIKCVSVWTESWINKGWKTSKGEPVKNKDIIEKIYDELQFRDVEFVHVAAHKTDDSYETTNNNAADKMALAAATGLDPRNVIQTVSRNPLIAIGEAMDRGEKPTPEQIDTVKKLLGLT